MTKQESCQERVGRHLEDCISDIRQLWEAECEGIEEGVEDLGTFNEYGLCFDYVPSDTDIQEQGYFRYQISYGGPSEEFRFHCDPDLECYKIEFWLLDWFDGARKVLQGSDLDLMMKIYEFFKECGTVEYQLEQAQE